VPILGAGYLWVRQSPFVAVQRVSIVGVSGADAQAVDTALTDAARAMSTLDVNDAALRAAVAPLHLVRSLRAAPDPPHALRIEVVEQLPVAVLEVDGMRTAVAGDGVALGRMFISSSLPSVAGYRIPAPGRSVRGAQLLAELAVLGAAPAPLAAHVERVFTGSEGLTVQMRNGLKVYFGDGSEALAKWLSLARVLADPSSAGASYVDVRLPTHPAAGFPAGVNPPDAGSAGSTATGSARPEKAGDSEATIEELAEALSESGGVSNAPPATEPQAGTGESQAGTGEAQAGTGEAQTGASEAQAGSGGGESSAQQSSTGAAESPSSETQSTPTQAQSGGAEATQ